MRIICLTLLCLSVSCTELPDKNVAAFNPDQPSNHTTADLFDRIVCDGFDFPVGNKNGKGSYRSKTDHQKYNSWYIAAKTGESYELGLHTGEDWNGNGGGNTDLGQPVYAIGKGKVLTAADHKAPWGNIVAIQHLFLDNGRLQSVISLYAHLEKILVAAGDEVSRRQQIGTIGTGNGAYLAHLHLEIRKSSIMDLPYDYWPSSHGKDRQWILQHYHEPSDFIARRRELLVPAQEGNLLLVTKNRYTMDHYQQGRLTSSYEIALSQNPVGHKQQQGDNRLPEGSYRIIQKSRGPFSGAYASYFGVAWMRINYPNPWDAHDGYRKGLISKVERDGILNAHRSGKEPNKHTKLGGGIGIHGWAGKWTTDRHLTWGCISMHNNDLDTLYDQLPLSTPIIILP